MKHKKNKLFLIILILLICAGLTCVMLLFLFRNANSNEIPTILRKTNIDFPQKQVKNNFSQSQIKHVFVIIEENHDWSAIYKNPKATYINKTLLKEGSYARNYHSVPKDMDEIRPSEPNYIFMEAGVIAFSDHTFTTNDSPNKENSTSSKNHLVTFLEKKGYSWKSYQEGIKGDDCPINKINNYVPKHNPFIFFHDVSGNPPNTKNKYCQEHIRPLSELKNDLAIGNIANYVFITPDLKNDMHDGSIADADAWLAQTVPMITNSQTFKKDGALFITWDESTKNNEENEGDNNAIGMIVLSPFSKVNYTNSIYYSHASFVKTIQEIFGLKPLLGYANDPKTTDLFDFFDFKK